MCEMCWVLLKILRRKFIELNVYGINKKYLKSVTSTSIL